MWPHGSDIQASSLVRDLGIILDTELSFRSHISQLVSWCFLQLCRMKSCVHALLMDAAKTVVNSFVIFSVVYCNSLLAGASCYQLNHLQLVLNTAAWLLVGAKKHDSIRHVPQDPLHWLPVSVSSSSCLHWHSNHCMVVLCDTFDTLISIVSTNVLIPVSKIYQKYHGATIPPSIGQYQFPCHAVCSWIALLLTSTAYCVTAMKKTRHIKACQTCSKHIF